MDHSTYHSLGSAQQDPNDPNNRLNQPPPNQFQPQIAPNPYQQQQQQQQFLPQGTPLGTPQGQQFYGTPSTVPPGGPSPLQATEGYFQSEVQPDPNDMAAQMADMSLGADGHHAAGAGKKKKKDRHAYHQVEATGSSQAFNGIPPVGTPATAFLNADPSGTTGFVGQPALSPQIPGSPFPAPANVAYTPGSVASPAEFAARDGSIDATIAAGGQSGGKVSQDELPSVPVARDAAQKFFLTNVYPTFEQHVPPPAAVSFVAVDQGNSSPKFARLTMNNIPATAEALHTTGIPLGLMLQPLARVQPGEAAVPVLDFGDLGPPRCRRCRAYINPFMMFRSGGNKYVCNLCTYPNDTPPEYFCATSPQGIRVDRDQRPELCHGTVEFVCPKEYYNREPVGLRWLFVVDVTQEAYNKGYLEAFCDGILATLYGADENEERDENGEIKRRIPPNARVGFVTYDKEVHFYNCSVSDYSDSHASTRLTDNNRLHWNKLR